jgi:hypothetical protein
MTKFWSAARKFYIGLQLIELLQYVLHSPICFTLTAQQMAITKVRHILILKVNKPVLVLI